MITPPRTSKSKQLADAVAQWLRDHLAMEVKSQMSPQVEKRTIPAREIICYPMTRESQLLNRALDQDVDYEIGVAILEPIQSSDKDAEDILVDGLLALVESIGDAILGTQFESSFGEATVMGYTHEPLFDFEYHRQFLFAGGIALQIKRTESR